MITAPVSEHPQRSTTSVVRLGSAVELHPQVALRPEPFGSLAYHYGNRRLVFVRKLELVDVLRSLGAHDSVADALEACAIDRRRWPSFVRALDDLMTSEIIRARSCRTADR